jgi:uncharacterized membrane protein YkoI
MRVQPAFTGLPIRRAMPLFRLPAAAIVVALAAAPAFAADADRRVCLNKEAQRAAVLSGQALPLAKAIHAVRGRNRGELVRARLCRGENGLVYVLTLLARNGKVTRATIDAANGSVIGGR